MFGRMYPEILGKISSVKSSQKKDVPKSCEWKKISVDKKKIIGADQSGRRSGSLGEAARGGACLGTELRDVFLAVMGLVFPLNGVYIG